MQMHIVDGVLNSMQIEEGGLANTKATDDTSQPYQARFYSFEDGTILYIIEMLSNVYFWLIQILLRIVE